MTITSIDLVLEHHLCLHRLLFHRVDQEKEKFSPNKDLEEIKEQVVQLQTSLFNLFRFIKNFKRCLRINLHKEFYACYHLT